MRKLLPKMMISDFANPGCYSMVAALSACARSKDLKQGRIIHGLVYRILKDSRPSLNNALIDLYGKTGRIELAQRVFDNIKLKDVVIWTSLLNGYLLNGDVDSGKELFDAMPQRNVVSWTAMIVGYVRNKATVEALKLFSKMRHEDAGQHINPTTVTMVALLSGCADIGALNMGSSIHGYVNKRTGFVLDTAINNALIDMYGKSGSFDSAVKLFDSMLMKDLFSWTSIISCSALNGSGKYALLCFNSMVESGMQPNEVTFLSVLSACSHSGLVVEGERLFRTFINRYHMKTCIEHFGTMVDLFVRAGHLDKAIQLIQEMPIKPDALIWKSVLRAYLSHGNIELAEMAWGKVLELEPNNDGAYVLLGNLYRTKNRWEDASRTSKMMRNQRLKKTPGCTWIELNGVVHEFLAEAYRRHVHDEIVNVLDGLLQNPNSAPMLIFLEST